MILGRVPMVRRRRSETRDALGYAVFTHADTPFTGSIQPLGRKDREALPEGLRSTVERQVYTDPGTLRTTDQLTGEPADFVLHEGTLYEVVHVDTWVQILSHDHAFLVRVQEPDPGLPETEEEAA